MARRIRIDRLLVERGLFESRAKAQQAIAAGLVTADDVVVGKPSDEIATDAALAAAPAHPWVSRGALKLVAALDHFRADPGFDPTGCVCLDVGASTGGFAEVLIARGARRVYAVDVGREQLHASLRTRPQVISLEETDIRCLEAGKLAERPSFITVDVSFISLKLVLPAVLALAATPATLLALIKPQFEAGRGKTKKGKAKKGILRDPLAHAAICADISDFVAALGCTVSGIVPSPIAGGDGNREFFIGARRD